MFSFKVTVMSIPSGSSVSILIVFSLILLPSWTLVYGQTFCLNSFDDAKVTVEPVAIYSRGTNIKVTIEDAIQWSLQYVGASFYDQNENLIDCSRNSSLIKFNQTLMIITCITESLNIFENNITVYLSLYSKCYGGVFEFSQVHYVNTIIADPDIEAIFPLTLIAQHTNRIFLYLKSVFPSVNATFDIDIGNHTFCRKERTSKLVVYDCFFNRSIPFFLIRMNGYSWDARIVQFVPRPEILSIKGSTFEKALVPICFTGRNFDSFFSPVLYTVFSNESNACNVTSNTSMCCLSALGLEPINEVTFFEAQLYSHYHPLANVLLRQTLIPLLTHTEFSFRRNELTITLQHFEMHYAPFTSIAVYDSARQFMVDCVPNVVASDSIICNPKVKISLSGKLTHYVMLNISQWSIIYPQIDSFTDEMLTSFQLIILLVAALVFVMLISWLFIIIYYGCFDSVEGMRISSSYFYRSRKSRSQNAETKSREKRKHLREKRNRGLNVKMFYLP